MTNIHFENRDRHKHYNYKTTIRELYYSTPFCIEQGLIQQNHEDYKIFSLRDLVVRILSSLYSDTETHISFALMDCTSKETQRRFSNLTLTHNYIILIETSVNLNKLKSVFKIDFHQLSIDPNSIYWFEGEELSTPIKAHTNDTIPNNYTPITKEISSHTTLPEYLDSFIFDELEAIYEPDFKRFEYNLDLSKSEVKTYLGTYFPRSYAESYCIFENLFSNENFYSVINLKKEISILDFGAGTSGEIVGLLRILDRFLPNLEQVNILAIDGNQSALRYSSKIIDQLKNHCKFSIRYRVGPAQVFDDNDLLDINSIVTSNYDFIISFKSICELISKNIIEYNAYKYIAENFAHKLSEYGVMVILDVTIKNETIGTYYPIYLNNGIHEFINENQDFKSLIPLSCNLHEDECTIHCFTQRVFKVTHSHKSNDISKVSYRVIARKTLIEIINPINIGKRMIIQEKINKKSYCPLTSGETTINAFNLNN